jgi:hypothetical protein
MTITRWASIALVALALPACATAGSTPRVSSPAGQAAQPSSWLPASSQAQAEYAQHAGPRGQAAQPHAWVGTTPAYPVDQHRLAQEGMTYLGGRAAQGGSWTPQPKSSWTIASNDARQIQQ